MAKFTPALIVPASQVEGFGKTTAARSVKDVALANIDKTKALFQDAKLEGKRHFTINGEMTSFSLRVNNSALVLGHYEQDGVSADVKEMAVPTANFLEALSYFADKIKAGEFDGQLEVLSSKREARTSKMKETRAARKADAKPA